MFSFLGDPRAAPAPGLLLDHAHQRAHPRHHPQRLRPQPDVHRRDRRGRAALLPEHRGQGQSLRRQGVAPDLPRAGRTDDARGLSERDFDFLAVRRADRRRAVDGRAGERAHPATGLRDRVRLLRSPRTEAELRDAGDRRAVSSPARSTARPATRRRRRRGCMPASTLRCQCRGEVGLGADARPGLSRRA